MKEKKKFILAIPTIIIIVVAVVGISLIFYNRNVKKMSREDAKFLSQKVANIENISCEVIITNGNGSENESVEDYKLKDGVMLSRADDFVVYDNSNDKVLMQVDDEEKIVYKYSEYKSEIDKFKGMILISDSLLEDENNEYVFKDYVTMNGIKCVNFEIKTSENTFEFWLDKKTGMTVRSDIRYDKNQSQMDVSVLYRYQINNVKDDDVKKPDITDYKVIEL